MSKLSEVLANFGFETQEKQTAFLENLYLAGYFQDEKMWQMLNLIRHNKAGEGNVQDDRDLNKDFLFMCMATNEANANQGDPQLFNAKTLLDNLFNHANLFDNQDIEDMVLYIAQTAFARSDNQERNELKPTIDQKNNAAYLANAKKLQLFDAIEPEMAEEFDETWVQGAARSRIMTRLQHAKELRDKGVKMGAIRLLTGERELWVEIDKIGDDVEGAKKYMLDLADKNGIALNKEEPFIVKTVGATKRTFVNYRSEEGRKLTETIMAEDLYREIFGEEISCDVVTDSEAAQGKTRPDTVKAAQDTAKESLQKRLQSDLAKKDCPRIMIVSNQPYLLRQALSVQRGVRVAIGYERELSFCPVGKACEVEATGIHSELGALVAEQYMLVRERGGVAQKIPLDNILYSKRCNKVELCPPMPTYASVANPQATKISKDQVSQLQ